MTTYNLTFGTLETGEVIASRESRYHRSYYRTDRYTRTSDGQVLNERCAVIDKDDETPRYGDFETRYHENCPACFLGHTHSAALHNAYAPMTHRISDER